VSEVVLIEAGSLPKTTSGKLQRSATRDQYLRGTLGRVRRRTDVSAVA
jgi:acyl-CoA synthetase (AMP-forming)/AMP-acid ligase II